MSIEINGEVMEGYYPVGAERYCEERGIICPWVVDGSKDLCPMTFRLDNLKEVIEVFGAVGFRHYLGEEEIKIKHYENHGYKCTVVWEWDCFLPVELDNIFGVSNVK